MFFAVKNLTEQTLSPCEPWKFQITENITEQIRQVKEDRQAWYQNPNTLHNFYTAIEPINPNIRPGKDNPPHKIHAFAVDYDIAIPDERINEAVAAMKIKPAWVERSLGGNCRLVWTLPFPLLVDDATFCGHIMGSLPKWLNLDLLPNLDEPALKTFTRLLCNGGVWRETGHGSIDPVELQAFFVRCGKSFRFRPSNDADIPLDVIEKKVKEIYPNANWPGEFAEGAQGPSFWIPESTSPMSAIIKKEGILTFSAHATKPFYPWADIVGLDFVKDYLNTAIAKATQDIYWDSKNIWRKVNGIYVANGERETNIFLKVDCKLSAKADKSGISPLENALSHIHNHNRVKSAGPFVFRPSGIISFQGERMLNTYVNRAIQPVEGKQTWGVSGNFPFISMLLDNLFDPVAQLAYYLAWWKYYYICAFEVLPLPGQNIFTLGGAGIGKTYLNRELVGASVGGYIDASDYLLKGSDFNSHLFHVPHWCLDDDSPANSPRAMDTLHAMFKKMAANQQHVCNEKFRVAGPVGWAGRIGCTANLDFQSTRVMGPMDNSSLDKTCIFRCVKESLIKFPSRKDMMDIAARELPYFLRWLLDWTPPDYVEMDSRYGYKAYHDKSLLEQSVQSSSSAPFKELWIESLDVFFKQSPEETEWSGPVTQVVRLMLTNPLNNEILRSVRLEQANRYLEQIQKEGLLKCSTETGPMGTRIWKFQKPTPLTDAPAKVAPTPMPSEVVSVFTPQ